MKRTCDDLPLIFDVTHALQCRDPGGAAQAGAIRKLSTWPGGHAVSLAGLFLEAHPHPSQALRWPSALPLDQLEPFLTQVKAIDDLVKQMPTLSIE